jgi:uncharacterized damage-inducible protein DinB
MPILERDQILEMFGYHHWAADRMLAAFAAVTAAELDQPWGGSFATGRGLLRHVLGAEWLWCQRWNGTSPSKVPEFPGDLDGAGFRDEWRKLRVEQQAYFDELSQSQLGGELSYVNLKGERWSYSLSDVLLHVVNHGTYHRGQLAHLLRDLRQPAPSTDYLLFVEERRGDGQRPETRG